MTPPRPGLTLKQERTLRFIEDRIANDGVPPTMTEISKSGITTSLGEVDRLISALERYKYIRRPKYGRNRGIELNDSHPRSRAKQSGESDLVERLRQIMSEYDDLAWVNYHERGTSMADQDATEADIALARLTINQAIAVINRASATTDEGE